MSNNRPVVRRTSMAPALLAVPLLAGALACGAQPQPHDGEEAPAGSLALALRTESNGMVYRLRAATFEVTGREQVTLETESDLDAPVINRALRAGDYQVELRAGWRLERSSDGGTSFTTVRAELTSTNPRAFTIRAGVHTPVGFQFRIAGSGELELSIVVVDESLDDAGVPAPDAGPPPDSAPDPTEPCPLPAVCTSDLSHVGVGDFTIAFRMTTTTSSGESAILAQRAICSRGALWYVYWFNNAIGFRLDDGVNLFDVNHNSMINDGLEHEVRICRTAGTIRMAVDGFPFPPAGPDARSIALEQLAPLSTKTSVCVGVNGSKNLAGTLANVCVGPR